jgi:hypothetical protein
VPFRVLPPVERIFVRRSWLMGSWRAVVFSMRVSICNGGFEWLTSDDSVFEAQKLDLLVVGDSGVCVDIDGQEGQGIGHAGCFHD